MPLLQPPDRERGFNKERIIRVLLNHTGDELTKYRLAQLSEASEPWTRQYTQTLEDQGLIDGTAVVAPVELYETWLAQRIEPEQVEVALQQPMNRLAETDLRYALTTYQAENLQQGFLFTSTTDFYISPEEINDWLAVVEENGLLGGGNTRIRVLDDHVFYNQQTVDDFPTVSIPQLILDLLAEGGPCEEAAAKLIEAYHGDQRW
jgi:hypothetical protein